MSLNGINNAILQRRQHCRPAFSISAIFPALRFCNALTQLDGEDATGAQKGAFQLMTQFLDLMLDPTAGGRQWAGGGGATRICR